MGFVYANLALNWRSTELAYAPSTNHWAFMKNLMTERASDSDTV